MSQHYNTNAFAVVFPVNGLKGIQHLLTSVEKCFAASYLDCNAEHHCSYKNKNKLKSHGALESKYVVVIFLNELTENV